MTTPMRAITVQQPWAWAIIHGSKNIENRTQLWSYRGPLAIHAGARWSKRGGESDIIREVMLSRLTWDQRRRPIDPAEHLDRFMFRAIIGVIDLVDAHWGHPHCCDSNPWAELNYEEYGGANRTEIAHLVLENPRPVQPIDCKGRLGLWTPTPDIAALIDASLAGSVSGVPQP